MGSGAWHDIGLSSALGIRSVPLQVPYCVAKAGTMALYEGLRLEERRVKSGVEVTRILPVSVNTPFYDSAPSWLSKRPAAIPPVYHPSAVAKAIVFAAENPRRHIFVGAAAAQLAMLQWLSPALTDRLLTVADQIFVRQERDQADRGESNLYEPRPGQGATTGTSVRFTLRRSHWTRLVGFHPGAARAIGLVAATALGLSHRCADDAAAGSSSSATTSFPAHPSANCSSLRASQRQAQHSPENLKELVEGDPLA